MVNHALAHLATFLAAFCMSVLYANLDSPAPPATPAAVCLYESSLGTTVEITAPVMVENAATCQQGTLVAVAPSQ
jgi:ABC-type spermidine/putrescine transport system permease subunit II